MDERETMPHRAKKNRRRWCRGKPGNDHAPHVVFKPYGSFTCKWVTIIRGSWQPGYWTCYHREECQLCGKVLNDRVTCPDRPPGLPASKVPWSG
jgi:hypothetical protein